MNSEKKQSNNQPHIPSTHPKQNEQTHTNTHIYIHKVDVQNVNALTAKSLAMINANILMLSASQYFAKNQNKPFVFKMIKQHTEKYKMTFEEMI